MTNKLNGAQMASSASGEEMLAVGAAKITTEPITKGMHNHLRPSWDAGWRAMAPLRCRMRSAALSCASARLTGSSGRLKPSP